MTLQVACETFITAEDLTCACEGEDEETIQGWLDAASDVIAIMTGGIVAGRCIDVVRPRGDSVCGCVQASCCACGDIRGITLPGPNPQIIQVLIDGDLFTDWFILDGKELVRSDGRPWPSCQNLSKESTEDGTFEITVESGLVVDTLMREAASEIVCMMLRHPAQSTRQGHPGTRSVSIAGVNISLEQIAMEAKNRTFMMPYVTRLMTVYAWDGPVPSVVYSPELEDGWTLHRVTQYGS